LSYLFNQKCAYCETSIGSVSTGNVDHFRPKAEAIGLKGESTPDGYWWLAYEWENLLFACELCNRNKRNQFAVLGRRAKVGAIGSDLHKEKAYLLNPCVDYPEDFLTFDDEGYVLSRAQPDLSSTELWKHNRARITIETLGLNRPHLVAARKREVEDLTLELAHLKSERSFFFRGKEILSSLFYPSRPFLGLRRHFIKLWSLSLYEQAGLEDRQRLMSAFPDIAPEIGKIQETGQLISAASKSIAPPTKGSLVRIRKAQAQGSAVKSGHIKCIEIRNFKAIRHLVVQFPPGSSDRMGWKVLLGENGVGKSTVLQAVAFALMGPEYFRNHLRRFKLSPKSLLRRSRGNKMAGTALIRIEFSTGVVVKLTIKKTGFQFSGNPPKDIYVRGYGATRLLPRGTISRHDLASRVSRKTDSLFSPFVPGFNAHHWLAGLKDRKQFGSAALALKDLLRLPGMIKLHVEKRKVLMPLHGIRTSLDDLSAGFESVLIIATDIMSGVIGSVHDLTYAPGVVLLDEIDAHLHPRWKMRIVESLRRTFSSMQFIVTTHEPLCLRGLNENEVMVLKREGNEIVSLDNLPSPSGMRVDQLLTSELFGLHSAVDPEIDEIFAAYYKLLAKDSLSSTEQQKLEELRKRLPDIPVVALLGNTQREQLIYEAVDGYLARELVHRNPRIAKKIRSETRDDVKKQVADIWKDITSRKEQAH